MTEEPKQKWKLDKHIPIVLSTGMLIQLVTMVWLGSAFYTQTNANQAKNEDRFTIMAEARKKSDERSDSIQAVQTQMLAQLAAMNERINSQTDVMKDIKDILRQPPSKGR